VAIGMVLAFDLSAELGLCAHQNAERVRSHLRSAGLPVTITEAGVDRAELLPLMRTDKKNAGGALKLVLTRGIGDAFLSEGVDEAMMADFCRERVTPHFVIPGRPGIPLLVLNPEEAGPRIKSG
jgi:3-dehydroquinate synthetase